ncbi:hypothetical protein GCM10029964_080430 [Kibdelosporangium lantanae]
MTDFEPGGSTPGELEADDFERVAVVGMACRVPGASNVDSFWGNLVDGVESIEVGIPPAGSRPGYVHAVGRLDGLRDFDAEFFGITPRDAEHTDPQHRLFLEQSWIALQHAGVDPARYPGRVGVWGGCGFNGYFPLNLLPRLRVGDTLVEYPATLLHGNDKDYLTSRVAYRLGLRGPAVTVQTACSTSLVAVAQACQSLLDYQCDVALAGGASVKLPEDWGYVYEPGGIQSPDGHCRAFDADAAGTVFTSGVGVVALKRLSDALRDRDLIHAVILGSAVNSDGSRKAGYTAPSVDGQVEAVAEAYVTAGVNPDTVGYVEAHGTGTAVGDPIELAALDEVFADAEPGSIPVGSVKTNVGHLNAASGVIGLIKAVLTVRHGQIPATLHYRQRNPRTNPVSRFVVNDRTREWAKPGPRRAGVSSFGVGGTNVHVVIEQPPEVSATKPRRARHILAVSAHNQPALAEELANLGALLKTNDNLADIAYTLQCGRAHLGHRVAVVCETAEEGAAKLAVASGTTARDRPAVAFRNADGDAAAWWGALGVLPVALLDEDTAAGDRVVVDLAADATEELARAWEQGVLVDWTAYRRDDPGRIAELPGYPFQRRRHWVDAPTAAVVGPEEVTETDESVSGQVDALWRELLGIEEINAADDLFVLGGDSLVAMRLIARADHTFGTDLPLDDFLDEPTPARMAELVRTALTEKDGVRT